MLGSRGIYAGEETCRRGVMTIAEKPQGYTQLYKRYTSAHMCTIENTEKLCKGTLEACSVVMVPSVMSCGRGAWVSTMRGAHKKSARAACPWRWGQGQRPAPGTPIVAGPGFILGNHNHARRPCSSQSSSSTVRQPPSFDGGNVGATAGMAGNPACDYPRSNRDSHALGRVQRVCWRVETWR